MKDRRALRHLIPLLLMLACLPAQAGGPLYVGGIFGAPGVPFVWTISPVTYWTDQGLLGTLTNAHANDLVLQAFTVWQDVPTATINFSRAGSLSADVTGANILSFLNAQGNCFDSSQPTNAIIYDVDGSIIQALGDDPDTILGEATAACLSPVGGNHFERGHAILNSKGITPQNQQGLYAVMVHEFGHLIGLDHSQINLNCLTGSAPCTAEDLQGVPTMFPVLISLELANLAADDIGAVSALYPEGSFATSTGRITGHVLFADGASPAQGFNVIARSVTNPRTIAVSSVSGYLFTPDAGNAAVPSSLTEYPFGSRNQAYIGYYDIPGLPPGDYTIEVEAINTADPLSFVGGSGLGPFGQLGFQFPLPSQLPQPPACSVQHLVSGNTASCIYANATQLTVSANQTVSTDTDLILIGTPPRYDAWEDGP